jgi:twitching motility protein PilJ
MRFFTNMKLTMKLVLILSVILAGFIVIGITYLNIVQAERKAIATTSNFGRLHVEIENIVQLLGQTVTHQRDFLLHRRLEDLQAFESAVIDTREELEGLQAQASHAKLKKLISVVQDSLNAYHDAVSQLAKSRVAVGLEQGSGLLGDMHLAVQELETSVTALNDDTSSGRQTLLNERLITSILKMHRYENEYLQREAFELATPLFQEFANFIELVEQSSFSVEQKSQLGSLLFVYHDRFNLVVKALINVQSNRQEVNTTFDNIGPSVDDLVDTIETISTQTFDALEGQRKQSTHIFTLTFLFTSTLVTLLMFIMGRGIIKPLRRLQSTVQQVNQGDMTARAHMQQRDEIGALADAFDNLLDERMTQLADTERERAVRLAEAQQENETLNNSVVELLQAVAQLSQRDLTIRVPVSEDVTGPVADALNLLTHETAQVLLEVTTISNEVAMASRNVKTQSDVVVNLANTERAQVSQTSSELAAAAEAMNEIAALAQTCNTTAERAIERTQTALETVTNTVTGINATRDTIRETEKRIKRLGERSQEISGAVNLINNIAERTHILALNASMHAASAGEAGRGFAVVADEVQRLAENARQATEQIASLVGNIQIETMDTVTTMNTVITQVVEGSRLAEQAGEQMRETQHTTAALGKSVREIAESSQSQAMISNELRNRAGQIVESTLQTNQQLEAQGEQTARLLGFSSRLVEAVNVFKLPGQQTTQVDAEQADDPAYATKEREDWEVMVQS